PLVKQVHVFDVASVAELACVECDEAMCSEDGKTLVTLHEENSRCFVHVWDLPLRPPLLLVVGIPLGLGLLVFLFSRWRARRRGGSAPAKGAPVTMNPEQKL